jgi:hypothetical protein
VTRNNEGVDAKLGSHRDFLDPYPWDQKVTTPPDLSLSCAPIPESKQWIQGSTCRGLLEQVVTIS